MAYSSRDSQFSYNEGQSLSIDLERQELSSSDKVYLREEGECDSHGRRKPMRWYRRLLASSSQKLRHMMSLSSSHGDPRIHGEHGIDEWLAQPNIS